MRAPDGKPMLFISVWDLHPETEMAHDLIRIGHYSLALREVADRFIERCRDLARDANELRIARQPGGQLIRSMFAAPDLETKPLFAFNECGTRNERTEQRGLWNLAQGLIDAFRNPRSHGHDAGFSPAEAFVWLGFLSAMHDLIDTARYLGPSESPVQSASVDA